MEAPAPKKAFSRIGFFLLAARLVFFLMDQTVLLPIDRDTLAAIYGQTGVPGVLLLFNAPEALMCLLLCLLLRTIPKCEWEKESMRFRELAEFFVMSYAVSGVSGLLGRAVSRVFPAVGPMQTDSILEIVGPDLKQSILLVAVIGSIVIAPILEELVFRKLMIDRLHNYGEKTVIVFSALCFGLFHGNLPQFLVAFGLGIFLGYVYCKTGRVLYTIMMHSLHNTITSRDWLLEMLEAQSGEFAAGAEEVIPIVLSCVLIAGFVKLWGRLVDRTGVLICRPVNRSPALDDPMPGAIPKGEVFRTVYLNPGVILFFIAAIIAGWG